MKSGAAPGSMEVRRHRGERCSPENQGCQAIPVRGLRPAILQSYGNRRGGKGRDGIVERGAKARQPMSEIAIRAEGLGKLYRIGQRERENALRNVLGPILRAPWKLLKREKKETFWALRDASLEVKQGDVLGIIGRNGAGKTTLLKILSRITRPTKGWAEIYGRVGCLLEVGTGFHPELSGRDNVYLSGAILGMTRKEIRSRFDEIVAFAEIEKFIDTPVKHYSSGMYVRLAFAVAAHLETDVLIVDEVLAVGDVQFQRKCLGKMKEVGSGGRTVLFVSHNLNAIASLCRSAMVIANGEVVHYSRDIQRALQIYAGESVRTHTVDLICHPGRTSQGPGVYREIAINSEESGLSHMVSPGSNLHLRLRVIPTSRIIEPKLTIGVTSIRGERIFAIGTSIGGTAIPKLEGPAIVNVRFRLPNLVPGEYSFDIGCYDRVGTPLDEIYGAAAIEVLKDDYISMIDPHSPYMGQIMVRSEWSAAAEDSNSAELISPPRD
jgi:lipopolysaccharide transport system ATP-binding protein